MLAVKVVQLAGHMGPGREAALRREALVLELAAMQDYCHPNLLAMQVGYTTDVGMLHVCCVLHVLLVAQQHQLGCCI